MIKPCDKGAGIIIQNRISEGLQESFRSQNNTRQKVDDSVRDDPVGLYDKIPPYEGVQYVGESLEERPN